MLRWVVVIPLKLKSSKLTRVSLINGMDYGLEQWNGIVECTNRKTVFNEKLYYTRHSYPRLV